MEWRGGPALCPTLRGNERTQRRQPVRAKRLAQGLEDIPVRPATARFAEQRPCLRPKGRGRKPEGARLVWASQGAACARPHVSDPFPLGSPSTGFLQAACKKRAPRTMRGECLGVGGIQDLPPPPSYLPGQRRPPQARCRRHRARRRWPLSLTAGASRVHRPPGLCAPHCQPTQVPCSAKCALPSLRAGHALDERPLQRHWAMAHRRQSRP